MAVRCALHGSPRAITIEKFEKRRRRGEEEKEKRIIGVLVPAVAAVTVWLWSVKTRTRSAAHTEMEVTTGDRTTYHNFDGQTVEADIAGEVAGVYIEEDGLVNAFDVTVQIVDLDRLEAELEIDEYDKAGSGLRQNRLCGFVQL